MEHMVVWTYPLALAGQDIRAACAPGGLIDRIVRAAAQGKSPTGAETPSP